MTNNQIDSKNFQVMKNMPFLKFSPPKLNTKTIQSHLDDLPEKFRKVSSDISKAANFFENIDPNPNIKRCQVAM
jgi:hypothetical protein